MRHISRRKEFIERQRKALNAMLETAWITGLLVAMVIASPFWLQALEGLGLYRLSPSEFGFMFGSVMTVIVVLIGFILKQRWDHTQKQL